MSSVGHLLVVACALAATLHAATIPDAADLHKKIPAPLPDDIKDPLPASQEIVAPEPAKEIGNELRVKPENIPVEVVVEDAESSVKFNEVDDEEIKRPAVDLRNPGPPQRQEHETQNPERHPDEQLKISTIKETIERTQNLLRESFQGVSDDIQNWFYKSNDQNKVQKNIQELRDTFTRQIQKLNDTIQAFVKPETSEPVKIQGEVSQRNYQTIESQLKLIKDNFYSDMETLSAGVELVTSLRSSAEGDVVKEETPAASPEQPAAPAKPASPAQPTESSTTPPGIVLQTINGIRDRITESLNNFQALFSPPAASASNPPANAQADTPGSATPAPWRPTLPTLPSFLTNFTFNPVPQLQNITFNPVSQFSNSITNIQNQGLNFLNTLFGPASSTAKPAAAANSPAADKPADVTPEGAADKPADASAPVQAAQPAAIEPAQAGGPIRQFLSSIPVVQRIQNSITNRDTPREPAQKSDEQSKGGWYGPPARPDGHGDNIDINSGLNQLKSEEVKESIEKESIKEEPVKEKPVKEEPVKNEPVKEEPVKETIKEEAEVRPESVPEKTE